MAVDPPYQRRGLGEALVQYVIALARDHGTPEVTLECRESNTAALALYNKYGFREEGRRKRYYRDGEDALILTVTGVDEAAYWRSFCTLCARHLRRYGLEIVVEA